MSFENIRKNIQSYFQSNFNHLNFDKIAWDNVDFNIPVNEDWLRFSVQTITSDIVSVGSSSIKIRNQGMIFIQIFVYRSTSTLNSDIIADRICDIFEGVQLITGETFSSARKNDVGQSEGWFQTNLSIPFYYDKVKNL